jgi:AcrR family transcriptional regulator
VAAARPSKLTLIADDPALGLSPSAFFARSGATQRGRLLDAVTRVVADEGYSGATVNAIVRAAGVSRSTFYEHFTGKDACLLESYRVAANILLERIELAAQEAAADGWQAALGAGLQAYVTSIREDPAVARAHFVELFAVGPDALTARREVQDRFASRLAALADVMARTDPALPPVDLMLLRLLQGGLDELVTQAVHAGRLDELEAIARAGAEGFIAIATR